MSERLGILGLTLALLFGVYGLDHYRPRNMEAFIREDMAFRLRMKTEPFTQYVISSIEVSSSCWLHEIQQPVTIEQIFYADSDELCRVPSWREIGAYRSALVNTPWFYRWDARRSVFVKRPI